MAVITISAALDMSQPDALGLGAYANFTTDALSFVRFSDDALNYTEFTGGGLFIVTDGVRVVNGSTVFSYTGGSVSAFDVVNHYNAGQYDAILPLFLAGDDRISGSPDSDVLMGLAGKDVIHGRSSRDVIDGGEGSDRLFGDNGNDTLTGRSGNDILRGGFGRDSLTGGGGRDKFVFDTALGTANVDTIEDFTPGKDTILLKHSVFASLPPAELLISEYVEGSSFNKAIEIFNGTSDAVDLATAGYALDLYSNGAAAPSATLALTGIVASGDVFVLANTNADSALTGLADVLNGTVINFNGDDAVVLRKGATIVDVIGQIGFDPGTEWASGGISTLNQTLRRLDTISSGDTNGLDAFNPSSEWQSFAQDTFDGLGWHDAVLGTLPTSAFSNGAPTTPSQHIIYDIGTGELSYDADGSGSGAAVLFAKVDPGTPLTSDDFTIV